MTYVLLGWLALVALGFFIAGKPHVAAWWYRIRGPESGPSLIEGREELTEAERMRSAIELEQLYALPAYIKETKS